MKTRSMLHFRVTGEGSSHQTVGNRCASDKRFEKIAVGSPIPGREAGAGEAHPSSRKRRLLFTSLFWKGSGLHRDDTNWILLKRN